MEYETKYMNDIEFVAFIKSLPDEFVKLISVDGKARWLITDENNGGEKYILRPESSRICV